MLKRFCKFYNSVRSTDLFMIVNLEIRSVVNVCDHKVAVEKRAARHNLVQLHVEFTLHLLLEKIIEPGTVLVVYQSIGEYPLTLVVPQAK